MKFRASTFVNTSSLQGPLGAIAFLSVACSSGEEGDAVTAKRQLQAQPNASEVQASYSLEFLDFSAFSKSQAGDWITLRSSEGPIDVSVQSRQLVDGYLLVHGGAYGDAASEFLLKGRAGDLSGYLTLPSRDVAFEISERPDGDLVLSEVELESIYPDCELPRPAGEFVHPSPSDPEVAARDGYLRATNRIEPFIGAYDDEDVRELESRPGAPQVLYLDITDVMNGAEPIQTTREGMWQVWQAVASGFSNFDVNVTTSQSVYNSTSLEHRGFAKFDTSDRRGSCCVSCFGSENHCKIGKIYDPYDVGRGVLHEFGHLLGLGHDGVQYGNEYFDGFDEYKWVPIMGYYHSGTDWGPEALYQWSIGEYLSSWGAPAHNMEDDFAVMTRYLDFLPDDIPPGGVSLVFDAETISAVDNHGQIETNTDSDVFHFTVEEEGPAQIHVSREGNVAGAMLDVHAELHDSGGALIEGSNPTGIRGASFDLVLEPGDYTLTIRGGAEGTPEEGFSNWSSIGMYSISGAIGGGTGVDPGTGGASGTGGSGGGEVGAGGSVSSGGAVGAGGTDGGVAPPSGGTDGGIVAAGGTMTAPPATGAQPGELPTTPSGGDSSSGKIAGEESGCSCDLAQSHRHSTPLLWFASVGLLLGARFRRRRLS